MQPATSANEIVSAREFAASRDSVWRAFSEPALLAQWLGPKGFANTFHEFDLRAGGVWRYTMFGPDGARYEQTREVVEVVAPARIVIDNPNPVHRFRMTIALEVAGERTRLTWRMVFDDAAEFARVRDIIAVANEENFDRLEAVLRDARRAQFNMTTQQQQAPDTSDREIVLSRVFRAPRELVWKAWTDPELVVKWWGPRGFTTTIETMDFRVGGAWKHTMHGPDGANYPNKSLFREIVPLERIVYSHGGGREDGGAPGASFVATWTFEDEGEGATRLTGRMVFPSQEARDVVVREYGAIEGGRQTLERLSEQLPALQGEPFVFTREFDAPLDLVWRAWTEREHFARWFGPKGLRTNMRTFDLRPGGMCHYSMTTSDGKELWGKAVYREVVPQERLVWINSFSDANAGITRHPLTKDKWPLQLLTTITFAAKGGRTAVTVHWLPYESDDEERRVFDAGRESMKMGWGGTMEQLTSYLADRRSRW